MIGLHAVSDAASPQQPASVVAWRDPELGVCGLVQARVYASFLAQDVGAQACRVVQETVRTHLSLHREVQAELRATPADATRQAAEHTLRGAFTLASREVHTLGRRRRLDLRASLDLAWMAGLEGVVGHVGDGRAWLVRKGLAHRLTEDHVEDDRAAPLGGGMPRLTLSLGAAPQVHPHVAPVILTPGDRLLLASAGVYRALDDLRLREALTDPSADGVLARLLGGVRAAGGQEDLALGLVEAQGVRPARPGPGRLETLAQIPLFAWCTERELLAIAGVTRPQRYRAGGVVFRQGEVGQELYLVIAGELAVERDGHSIALLGPGANFGEMALLDEPHRSATVRCTQDTELLVLSRDAFFSMLRRDPPLAVKVLWNMLLRISANLRATSEALAQRPTPGADGKR